MPLKNRISHFRFLVSLANRSDVGNSPDASLSLYYRIPFFIFFFLFYLSATFLSIVLSIILAFQLSLSWSYAVSTQFLSSVGIPAVAIYVVRFLVNDLRTPSGWNFPFSLYFLSGRLFNFLRTSTSYCRLEYELGSVLINTDSAWWLEKVPTKKDYTFDNLLSSENIHEFSLVNFTNSFFKYEINKHAIGQVC